MTKEKNENTKQSVKEVFKNNAFMIKLMYQASPIYIITLALDAIRSEVSIFCEHTLLIGYVLAAAEYGYPFRRVAGVILIVAALITLGMVFTVYAGDCVGEREKPKVREKIKMMLYEKAKQVDLDCYDNPDFYNDQVMAISEIDKQMERVAKFIKDTLAAITVFITTGAFFLIKDKVSIIFVVISFVASFYFNKLYNEKNFLVRVESIASARKRDYVKRIYYLNDYAKEIRLNPDVSDVLFQRFEEANDEVYRIEKKYAMKKWLLGFLKGYACEDFVSDVIFMVYLVYQVAVMKRLSFSMVAILYGSYRQLSESLKCFSETYPFALETSLYVGKIRRFLGYEEKIVSEQDLVPNAGAKELELVDVSFAYGDRNDMLIKDMNLAIKPGEKIALVGYNGAGKTTLVKLLMRLYDVRYGQIKADGVDIRQFNVKKYRETIGTVFQDFQVFAGSIKENILLDVPDRGEETRIWRSLSDSGLMDRTKQFEKQLETQLTTEFAEDGVNLSGGESQKLAIARVFYKDAGLMILDEPSSALDPIAEYQLNHAMLSATGDKTVIFISHRLSTTRLADRIIMLENGRIVEQGSHEALLEMGGKYAQMWRVQAGAYIAV